MVQGLGRREGPAVAELDGEDGMGSEKSHQRRYYWEESNNDNSKSHE